VADSAVLCVQGLPATVTSALTLTAERMKEKNVLVKKTDIIEALGSATRIASDKTGTLTQNKMTVMNCWVNRQYKSANEIIGNARKPQMTQRASHTTSKGRSIVQAISSGLARVSAGVAGSARRSVDAQGLDGIELSLPPAAKSGAAQGRTSSGFGTDMASRMSMGNNSIAVRPHSFCELLCTCRDRVVSFVCVWPASNRLACPLWTLQSPSGATPCAPGCRPHRHGVSRRLGVVLMTPELRIAAAQQLIDVQQLPMYNSFPPS
jgi:hypothetical protein